MKKFFPFLLLLILCVAAAMAIPAGATPPEDLNTVYAAAVQMTENNVLSGGTVTAQCPYCNESAVWQPLGAITSNKEYKNGGHFYLTQDVNNKAFYFFYKNSCLHLNGHNITSSVRAIYAETGSVLNIMGDGTVTGKGLSHSACDRGGALDIAGVANLFGGTYKHNGDYPVVCSRGGKGGINIYEGTRITGTSGYNGSNVRIYVSYLNMYGGIIENGIGTQGGNIMGTKNAKINIAGGTVTGGTVYMREDATSLTLSGSPKVDVINNFDGPAVDISGLQAGADIQIVGQGAITKADANIAQYAQYLRSPNELVELSVKDGAVYGTVDTTGDSDAPLTDGKTLKMLCLTSSFGLNTTELLYDVAMAEGYEDVIVARLYASGCTLKKHVDAFNTDTGIYWYTKFTKDGKYELDDAKLFDGLLDEDWDIIYIQQGAEQTPQLHTYEDYLDQLMDIVNTHKTNPDAKFIWNQTWAFQWDNPRKIFTDTFQGNQLLMHEAIIDAMQEKILTRSDFCALIPTGAAVQNARTSYFGDRLTKDTLHLNNLGRIIGGYTVLATLLDKDITEVNVGSVNSYDLTTSIRISETDRQVIMESVNNARKNPFAVYQSKYTPEYLNGIGAKAKELSFTGSSETTAMCPYCEKDVVWTPLTNSTSNKLTTTDGNWGHYYLAEDLTYSTKYITISEAAGHNGFCLHLNGHNIINPGKRAMWVGVGNTLNIMGSGTVSGIGEGSKEADWRATAVDSTGHVNLFGGTYTNAAARPVVMARAGTSRVNLFDGATIVGNTDYSVSAILMRVSSAEFNMWGGTVQGGKAANGGSIRLAAKATFNMFGGTMQGGQSTSIGGNVYATAGTINMYGGTIYGGSAENSSSSYGRGGNVALVGSGSAKPAFYMYGGTIGSETVTGEAAGYASAGGANLYVATGTADIIGDKAVIAGGYGKSYGGNIMVSSSATVTLTKGTVKNGKSIRGGNVYLAGTTSNFIQNGGLIENGTATESGGNSYVNNGNFTMAGGTTKGGTSPKGSNLHLKTGKTDATNAAIVHHDTTVSATAPVITGGAVLCEYNVTLGTFTSDASVKLEASTKLTVEDGLNLQNATFTGNTVDLAGHNIAISGSGNLTCFDSANEDLKSFGTLTLTGVTLNNPGYNNVNGKNYYTLQEGNVYSFHLLDWAITGASLRPSTAGIYFTGTWTCDAALAAKIDSFGVAVSLHNMPGADFRTDAENDNMWSAFTADQFQSGKAFNGIMIDGILKQTDADRIAMNPIYGKMPISAVAYITIGGETSVSEGVAMSLQDILSAVSEIPTYNETLQSFLDAWKPYGLTGSDWEF